MVGKVRGLGEDVRESILYSRWAMRYLYRIGYNAAEPLSPNIPWVFFEKEHGGRKNLL
jgi:hypothetical protein